MEYRICWSASSNISFNGSTDWDNIEDPDITIEEFENTFTDNSIVSEGLSIALEASGFEWWIETQ